MVFHFVLVLHCCGGCAGRGRHQVLGPRERDTGHVQRSLQQPRGETIDHGRHAGVGQGDGSKVFWTGPQFRYTSNLRYKLHISFCLGERHLSAPRPIQRPERPLNANFKVETATIAQLLQTTIGGHVQESVVGPIFLVSGLHLPYPLEESDKELPVCCLGSDLLTFRFTQARAWFCFLHNVGLIALYIIIIITINFVLYIFINSYLLSRRFLEATTNDLLINSWFFQSCFI